MGEIFQKYCFKCEKIVRFKCDPNTHHSYCVECGCGYGIYLTNPILNHFLKRIEKINQKSIIIPITKANVTLKTKYENLLSSSYGLQRKIQELLNENQGLQKEIDRLNNLLKGDWINIEELMAWLTNISLDGCMAMAEGEFLKGQKHGELMMIKKIKAKLSKERKMLKKLKKNKGGILNESQNQIYEDVL